jgi:hypothetical protein
MECISFGSDMATRCHVTSQQRMTLIDQYLPDYDVVERHGTVVQATPVQVYSALRTADLAASALVRVLFALRVMPLAFRAGASGVREARRRLTASITLAAFEQQGFAILAEMPPRELLIGLVGVFWTLRGDLRPVDAVSFLESPPPGTARAAWNFAIDEVAPGRCRLTTETRVQCADAISRRHFRRYWRLIRPGSGLIRRRMLNAIRRQAEGASARGQ